MNWEDVSMINLLLSVEGVINDVPARDGTAAFDLALGRLNDGIIKALISAPTLQPKEHMCQLLAKIRSSSVEEERSMLR